MSTVEKIKRIILVLSFENDNFEELDVYKKTNHEIIVVKSFEEMELYDCNPYVVIVILDSRNMQLNKEILVKIENAISDFVGFLSPHFVLISEPQKVADSFAKSLLELGFQQICTRNMLRVTVDSMFEKSKDSLFGMVGYG